jgi:hypothetical protein
MQAILDDLATLRLKLSQCKEALARRSVSTQTIAEPTSRVDTSAQTTRRHRRRPSPPSPAKRFRTKYEHMFSTNAIDTLPSARRRHRRRRGGDSESSDEL